MKTRRFFYPAVLFVSLLFLLVSLHTIPAAEPVSSKRKSSVVLAVENTGPAVVNINTEEVVRRPANPFYGGGRDEIFNDFFSDFFPRLREQKKQSLGSGVIIDSRGYILTNHHVIARATRIKVTLIDKRELEAKLIGADSRSDIAVIKIEAKERLPFVRMGRSDDLMIGETVIAIGNPFGLSHTVTTGVISALGRDIVGSNKKVFSDFIQLDASINPGNSGGPLLNIEGTLIGINTAIYQKAEGIGFAIPIDRAKRIVKDLIQYGKVHRVWLGLYAQDMNPKIAAYFGMKPGQGILVSKIFKAAPADRAGLKQGDIILEIDGKRVTSKQGYFEILSGRPYNKTLSLTIARERKVIKINMAPEKIPETRAGEIALDWLGFGVDAIKSGRSSGSGRKDNPGVVVTDLTPGGAAASVGIRPGDIVRQVNQTKVADLSDFNKAIVDSWIKSSVLLLVQRGPYGYYVSLEP